VPAVLEQAPVRDFVGQCVLERVLEVGKQAGLVQELRRLEAAEPKAKIVLRHVRDGTEECERGVLTDDRGRLEQAFMLGWEPVDTRGDDRLCGRRDLPRVSRLCQPMGAALADQDLRLRLGPDALLQKEGIALGPFDQPLLQRLEGRVLPEQGVE